MQNQRIEPIETTIHIQWQGPHPFHAVKSLAGPTDYGVYQIYGGHPVYGSSALLYIGRAAGQHFGERISREEEWLYNRDADRVEVYVGRLSGSHTLHDPTWTQHIELAERLLNIRALTTYEQPIELGEA